MLATQANESSWNWFDQTNELTGQVQQGVMAPAVAAAGAISNAYLGYQSLEEARKNREMQERYARVNLYNAGTAHNANVNDVADNNAAINGWDGERRDQYVTNNQVRTTL